MAIIFKDDSGDLLTDIDLANPYTNAIKNMDSVIKITKNMTDRFTLQGEKNVLDEKDANTTALANDILAGKKIDWSRVDNTAIFGDKISEIAMRKQEFDAKDSNRKDMLTESQRRTEIMAANQLRDDESNEVKQALLGQKYNDAKVTADQLERERQKKLALEESVLQYSEGLMGKSADELAEILKNPPTNIPRRVVIAGVKRYREVINPNLPPPSDGYSVAGQAKLDAGIAKAQVPTYGDERELLRLTTQLQSPDDVTRELAYTELQQKFPEAVYSLSYEDATAAADTALTNDTSRNWIDDVFADFALTPTALNLTLSQKEIKVQKKLIKLRQTADKDKKTPRGAKIRKAIKDLEATARALESGDTSLDVDVVIKNLTKAAPGLKKILKP